MRKRERERERQIERQITTVVKRETETYSGKKKREMVVYREIGRETWSKQDEESLVTRVKEIWSNR